MVSADIPPDHRQSHITQISGWMNYRFPEGACSAPGGHHPCPMPCHYHHSEPLWWQPNERCQTVSHLLAATQHPGQDLWWPALMPNTDMSHNSPHEKALAFSLTQTIYEVVVVVVVFPFAFGSLLFTFVFICHMMTFYSQPNSIFCHMMKYS